MVHRLVCSSNSYSFRSENRSCNSNLCKSLDSRIAIVFTSHSLGRSHVTFKAISLFEYTFSSAFSLFTISEIHQNHSWIHHVSFWCYQTLSCNWQLIFIRLLITFTQLNELFPNFFRCLEHCYLLILFLSRVLYKISLAAYLICLRLSSFVHSSLGFSTQCGAPSVKAKAVFAFMNFIVPSVMTYHMSSSCATKWACILIFQSPNSSQENIGMLWNESIVSDEWDYIGALIPLDRIDWSD